MQVRLLGPIAKIRWSAGVQSDSCSSRGVFTEALGGSFATSFCCLCILGQLSATLCRAFCFSLKLVLCKAILKIQVRSCKFFIVSYALVPSRTTLSSAQLAVLILLANLCGQFSDIPFPIAITKNISCRIRCAPSGGLSQEESL
jgi:hypothetical protein